MAWLCTFAKTTYTGNMYANAIYPYSLFCQLALSIFLSQLKSVSIMYTCLWISQVQYASTNLKYTYYNMLGIYLYCTWCMHGNTCTIHCKHTPVPCMECTCTMHGIRLYHAWNMPVPRMEYAFTTHGICLYRAWNTPVQYMEFKYEYTSTTHGMCMKWARFHAWNMHIS